MANFAKKKAIVVFQALLGITLLYWLITQIDAGQIRQLSMVQVSQLSIVTIVLSMTIFFESYRISLLSGSPPPLRDVNRAVLVSAFFANLLPSTVGGDAYKVYFLRKHLGLKSATLLVIADRAMGLFFLVSIVTVIFMFTGHASVFDMLDPRIISKATLLTICLCLASLLAVCLFFSRVRYALAHIIRSILSVGSRMKIRYQSAILLFHVVRCLALMAAVYVLGDQLTLTESWVVLTAAALVSVVPLSIASLGVREAAIVSMMTLAAVGTTEAVISAVIFRVANMIQGVIGYWLWASSEKIAINKSDHKK